MKNLITYLKTLWSRVADSQSSDVRVDRRRSDLRRSPSGLESSSLLKFVSVLVLILTIGVGQMWAATTYKLTQVSSVSAGNKYVFVQDGHAMSNTISSSALNTTTSYSTTGLAGTESYVWELLSSTHGFYMTNPSCGTNRYLKNSSSTSVSWVASSNTPSEWTFTFTKGIALIQNYSNSSRFLGYTTASSYVYKAYATSNLSSYPHDITVYLLEEESDCSSEITITKGSNPANGTFTISNSGTVCIDEGNASTTVTATPSDHYHLATVTSTGGGSVGAISNNTCTVSNISANTTINVTFAADPTYTVTWVAGSNPSFSTQTNYAGTALTDPGTPSSALYCPGGKEFVGWTATPIAGEDDDAPEDLFTSVTGKSIPVGGTTYYAVFADAADGSSSKTYELTIERGDVPSSYSGTWSAKTATETGGGSGTLSVSLSGTNVMQGTGSNATKIQFKASSTGFYNTTDLGTINSITTNNSDIKYYINSSTNPSSAGSGGYFRVYNNASGARYSTSIVITFTKTVGGIIYSNYATTCCADPGLNYGTGSVTKTFGDAVFTNALTNSHSVAVTYSSSDPTVATVNGSGQVTILKAGSTTITATFAGNATYCADDASYTLTVNKADISPTLTYTPNSVAAGSNTSAPTVGGNPGSGGVTYAITSASPSGCATIDAGTGIVTGVAVGSVTVTATVAATTNYNGGSATANVTITAASYFTNGATVFVQAESSSAWDASACVKAWFNNNGSGGAAQETFWLFDATGGDAGKKLFATVVPSTGDLNQVTLQRFQSDCLAEHWYNNNGTLTKASDGGSNTFRSTGSGNSNVAWNGSGITLSLYGDPNSWGSSLGTFADQGNGVWTATYNNYAPANAAGETQEFKISTNYNGWIGNTGSNNNATLDGMHVGSTYNITATLDVKDHSLTMSKTFVKGTVHFDLQGHGSAISDLTNVAAGSKISAPSPAPSVTGWDFGGWYKEPACTNAWDFANDVVNETMTLYAKWTAHEYTITKTLTNVTSSPAIPSTYTYTGAAAGLNYTISPSDGYRLPTTITVTGTTYTWNPATGALALTGTISSNVTITIVAVQTHTVDWYVGGSAPANKIGDDGQTTVVDHGGKIEDFPATTPDGTPCDKTFVGWTNTSSYVHGTSPLFNDVAGSPTINSNASFYAVFAEGDEAYNLVESDLGATNWAGDYLIAYSSTVFADGRIGGTGSNSIGANGSSVDPDDNLSANGKVVDATWGDTYNVTLELVTNSTNTYVLKTKDGNYNYISSNTNGINTTQTKGTAESHPISITFTSSSDIALCSHSTKFHYNTSSSGYFRFYSNGSQSAVYFYKKSSNYTGHTINCADCGTSVTPTYTASPTGGTVSVTKNAAAVASGSTVKTCTSQDLTVTLTPATHYDLTGFTATGLTTGTATITPAVGSTLPVSVAQTFTVTVSAGATGTLTLAPTFTAQTPLSITLETHSKGTFTPIGTIYSGDSFTFPEVTPNDAECADFVGWVEGTSIAEEGTSTEPTTIAAGSSSGTLTTNKTYTAVYAEKDKTESDAYVKVTSSLSNWSGTYLIVHDGSSRALDGSLTTTLGSTGDYFSVSITDGAIAATSTLATKNWTIAKIGETSTYTIKSASGYYIGRATASNGLDYTTTAGDADANSITYSSGVSIAGSASTAKLQYWVSGANACFKYYTSSQNAVSLYKLGTAEVVTYTYTVNPACTAKYRVTVNSATGGSPTADPKYLPEGETVTLTANPAAGYTFTSWTITKTTGGDNVTSTLLTGDKPTTANTSFAMPAYDVTVTAGYAKIPVTSLQVKDGETVIPNSGTLNISTGANKTLTVVVTPADAYDHSWTATVTAGGTYASITNTTAEGFRVNGLAQGDATITVTAPNDGDAKTVTFTVHVTDILPEEIILKRDGSSAEIETLTMYYDAANTKGQYVKVNVSYTPTPTNKAFTFSSAATGKVGSHSHAAVAGYEVLVANGVTTEPVSCTFTSSADGSVTKVLAVTVLPILTDQFVDYIHGNATQTVSARLSADRYDIITDINTPSLSDASDSDPTSEDCETAHYHLIGWLPQATAEALWAAGTPITEATEGLVKAGVQVEATGQTWYAIWGKEE